MTATLLPNSPKECARKLSSKPTTRVAAPLCTREYNRFGLIVAGESRSGAVPEGVAVPRHGVAMRRRRRKGRVILKFIYMDCKDTINKGQLKRVL